MVNEKENTIVLYDDLDEMYFKDENGEDCEYHYTWAEEDFENTFEGFEGEFVICGSVGLWDGKREGHSPKVFYSIMDASVECNNGFYGNIFVSEQDGEFLVDVSHHDGSNSLVIRELTDIGSDMWNNYSDVGEILAVEEATCKVNFTKRKKLAELDATISYYRRCIETAENIEQKKMWKNSLKKVMGEKQELIKLSD